MEGAARSGKLSGGTMLDDKYRIERLLAEGGMGAVYLGTHIKLRKRVAIKILNPQLSSASMIERFHREAITASQIGHEGIAQVTDLGTSASGEPFLVMEYLEGESLASRLRATGPLTVEDACELGCAILSPLGAAHRAGVVHRDLKPDNVFLVRQSRGEIVKLLDFGISRSTGLDPERRLTTTGLVLGTPYYMSPEQARGETEITPAADLYAFGVMLYEMLVGNVPIEAENYNQLIYRVMTSDYLRPRERRPDLPDAIEQIILRAMGQEPADRPASVADLERELLAFCRPAIRDHAVGSLSSPALRFALGARGSQSGVGGEHTLVAAGGSPARAVDTAPRTDPARPAALTRLGPRAEPTSALDMAASDGSSTAPGIGTGNGSWSEHRTGPRTTPVTGPGTGPIAGPPAVTNAPAPRRARTWLIAVVGALVVGGIAAAIAASTGNGGDRSPEPAVATSVQTSANATAVKAPSPAPVTPAAATPGGGSSATSSGLLPNGLPAAGEPATVVLRFAVEPATAAIFVDGTRISSGELVVPRDAAAHALRITAPGHVAHDETIRFDENQRLVVQLKRASERGRASDPSKNRPGNDRIDSESPYR